MSIARKLLGGATAGDTYVDDVFSTYLYEGTNTPLTIKNGIAIGDGLRGGLATYFDGTSNIKLNNGVEIVSSSSAYTVSFWIRTDDAETQRPLALSSNTFYSVERNRVRFYAIGSSGDVVGDIIHDCPDVTNGQWHHVVHSVTTNSSVMYFDGVQATAVAGSMNGSGSMQGLSTGLAIGGQTTSGFIGSLAYVFMDTNYRELTDESTLRLFINADGSPTSSATLEGLTPPVFFTLAGLFNAGSVPNSDFTVAGSPKSVEGCDQFITGEGGLAWIKCRTKDDFWRLYDSERPPINSNFAMPALICNTTGDEADYQDGIVSFDADGFSIDDQSGAGTYNIINRANEDYVSWTFRKAPSFFDVVTYTGDSVAGREIPHNLGVEPGMVIVKNTTSSNTSWAVYHASAWPASGFLQENNAFAASVSTGWFNNTEPTDSVFTVGDVPDVNKAGEEYVAYFFAHDDSDEGMIQCGSYTGTGAAGNEIYLGWEPQWVMVKSTTASDKWTMYDTMRGIITGRDGYRLWANEPSAESGYNNSIDVTPTGFKKMSALSNESGESYIYMAIRRPNKPASEGFEPEELFAMFRSNNIGSMGGPPGFRSGFPVDMAFWTTPDGGGTAKYIGDRLNQGSHLYTHETDSAYTSGTLPDNFKFDYNNGYYSDGNAQYFSWMWRRAPGFFDVVTYDGTGYSGYVYHNLKAEPEMMWVKKRNASAPWPVYHKDTKGKALYLNETDSATDNQTLFGSTATAQEDWGFYHGDNPYVAENGSDFIAYLFASVPGICDIGSYTGNGTTLDIDCGFTNGVRFILIKRTDVSGNWTFWDTTQGISSGDDPFLALNTTGAQTKNLNCLSPLSSGVTVKHPNVNTDGGEYIYMAIA